MELLKAPQDKSGYPITSLSSHVLVVIVELSFFSWQLSLPSIYKDRIEHHHAFTRSKRFIKHIIKMAVADYLVLLDIVSTATKFIRKLRNQ